MADEKLMSLEEQCPICWHVGTFIYAGDGYETPREKHCENCGYWHTSMYPEDPQRYVDFYKISQDELKAMRAGQVAPDIYGV